MNELVVIVEGETEQTFVRDQLAGQLAFHNTLVWPVLPGKRRNQGGVKKWEAARQDIIRTLKEGRYCSTMFDYYAMPHDWPGREAADRLAWNERATIVEDLIQEDVAKAMGAKFNSKFFIPYVQLHEFEALVFADVNVLADVLSTIGDRSATELANALNEIVDAAGHPEAINDGFETCPSRRISRIVPAYRKRAHGSIITSRIGIAALRDRCSHFATWLTKLEQLNPDRT